MASHNLIFCPNDKVKRRNPLEGRINFLLQSFSFDGELDQLDSQVEEIDNLMSQLTKLNEQLEPGSEDFTLHKQQHYQFLVSLKKIKEKIQEQKDRAKLDLQNATRYKDGSVSIEMQSIMEERHSLANSNKIALDLISETEPVRDSIRADNHHLQIIRDKTIPLSSTFQTTLSIMGIIKRQKVKHTVVLGLVAGLCVCFILWWWLRS